MKKFTFMLLTAFIAVAAMAAGPQKRDLMKEATSFIPQVQLGQKINAKQAPKELVGKIQTSTRARAQKKAATAADFAGDYTWDYKTSSETSTDLESLTTSAGSAHVTISASTETEGGITISGMFSEDFEATIVNDTYDYFQIAGGQLAGESQYGNYVIYGLYYYAGDETYSEGWYYGDIYGYLEEDGTIYIEPWLCRVLSGGQYDGYALTPYYVVGSMLTPAEPLTVITLPEGVEANDYVLTHDEGSAPVKVAVDGNDVYFQGMSYYCPEAWVKGTKEGNAVTFAAMQYMGEYGTYGSSYFFYNGETVFTYDPEADTYSAEGQVFGVLADRYYDGNYTNPVIAPVVEKAVMPADPEVTALTSTNYGYVVEFNVPLMDVNGDPLVASKLAYMIYTDTEGVIEPLTFTPATHSRLTEDMTEIPYGFTENYDFYSDYIYLNDLYSEDWNKIGIQSIYRGGGEENVTEIQWYTIKEYAIQNFTFDFNTMDVPTSATGVTDGDILEPITLTEKIVSLTISTKDGSSTENRFWNANGVPQLRVYSGTLTFSVPAGYGISEIKFNHNGKWGANTVNGVEIPNDSENNVATWTVAEGEDPASEVVVAIAANSQINSIDVTVETVPLKPVEAPEDLVTDTYLFQGFDTYFEEDVTTNVLVGFYGEKTVYIQGLSYYVPEAWVKGTLEGTTLTIPDTYLGIYTSWGTDYEITLNGATFEYDAEAGTFTTAELTSTDGEYLWDEFADVVLTKLNDVAATPADPEITGIVTTSVTYPKVTFYIPTVDVDGEPLITAKLTYQFFIEKNGEITPLVLETALYDALDEDMSEIPYEFTDNWDVYNSVLYLNQGEELASWDKIGLQSIYYGGDEVNKSNIAWTYVNTPVTVGEALYATYVAPFNVDFAGAEVEAFTATINEETGNATLNPVTSVPAGTAVVVKAAEAGTYKVAQAIEAELDAENELVAATEDVVADGTQYILSKVNDAVGFNKTTPGTTIAAGKGYMVITGAGVKAFYPFGDDATGISTIANEQLTIDNVIFNLAGQRIGKAQKGVNIVNGKKILK